MTLSETEGILSAPSRPFVPQKRARQAGDKVLLFGEGVSPPVPPVRGDKFMNKYDPHKHHRRSIRLKGWDYRSPGLYFVTICTHERENLFDEPDYRDIAVYALARISEQKHARHVLVDESVVMPNHAHAIFEFTYYADQADLSMPTGNFENALAGSLGVVVGRYKTVGSQLAFVKKTRRTITQVL